MEKQTTTFILNGNTYKVGPTDTDAIRQIPKAERQQLIELLEAVKLQDRLAQVAVQQAVSKADQAASAVKAKPGYEAVSTTLPPEATTERLGEGDIDDLMTRLIMEERTNQKPQTTPQTIYKWTGGIIIVVILLLYLF